MIRRALTYGSLITLLAFVFVFQTSAQLEGGSTTITIIMDASGSMQAFIEGGRTRIDVAREEIIALSQELDPNVDATLWVYGHRLPQDDQSASCLDIEEVIPLGPPDEALFASVVGSVNAIGYTPIATALGMAYSALPPDGRNIIILMSDGEESCGGDPCAIAAELATRNIELRIHTIGFAADAATRVQLQCVAEATGGNYYEAQESQALEQALEAATTLITGNIAIVDSDGNPASRVNFTAINSAGELAGTAVSTGSFPPGDYTVVIHTEPRFETTVTVVADQTATVNLPLPGMLQMVDADGNPTDLVSYYVYPTGESRFFNVVYSGANAGALEVAPGTYDIEIDTNPRTRQTVTVSAGETATFTLPMPGTLQLVDAEGNPNSDYALFIYPVGSNRYFEVGYGGTMEIAAGIYDVEIDTNPRTRQTVTVTAGETAEVSLPAPDTTASETTGETIDESLPPGTIQLIDAAGALVEGYFYVYPAGENTYINAAYGGTLDIAPGTYDIELDVNPRVRETVTVTSGETSTLSLPLPGMIQLVDAAGNPVEGYFYAYPVGGDRYFDTGYDGTLQISPGTYEVEIDTNPPAARQTVTVTAGETITVTVPALGTLQLLAAEGNENGVEYFTVYPEGSDYSVVRVFEGVIDLMAGNYEVVFDSDLQTRYPVTVTSGEVTEISLPSATVSE